jgi:hypothetical protein
VEFDLFFFGERFCRPCICIVLAFIYRGIIWIYSYFVHLLSAPSGISTAIALWEICAGLQLVDHLTDTLQNQRDSFVVQHKSWKYIQEAGLIEEGSRTPPRLGVHWAEPGKDFRLGILEARIVNQQNISPLGRLRR